MERSEGEIKGGEEEKKGVDTALKSHCPEMLGSNVGQA